MVGSLWDAGGDVLVSEGREAIETEGKEAETEVLVVFETDGGTGGGMISIVREEFLDEGFL